MKLTGISVKGDSGRSYLIQQADDGSLHCDCPAWRNKRGLSASERTCKHIDHVTHQLAAHFAKVHS